MANHKLLIPHVLVAEGGHSADPHDTALRYGHSGVKAGKLDKRYPNNFVHTNRGVIWGTYTTYKSIKKQPPNAQEFMTMTSAMWEDIFKTLYWDKIYGDTLNSQAIAEILVEAVWGGGLSGMVRSMQTWLNSKGANIVIDGKMGKATRDAVNKYVKTPKLEKELFDRLTAQRMAYLKSLSTWWKHGAGWTDRVSKLAARAQDLFGKTSTKVGIGSIVLVSALGYYLYKNFYKS